MDSDTMRQLLEGVGFPATTDDVVTWAKEHGAGTDELEVLGRLPLARYESIVDVLDAADRVRMS
jgi:hypothetical protein